MSKLRDLPTTVWSGIIAWVIGALILVMLLSVDSYQHVSQSYVETKHNDNAFTYDYFPNTDHQVEDYIHGIKTRDSATDEWYARLQLKSIDPADQTQLAVSCSDSVGMTFIIEAPSIDEADKITIVYKKDVIRMFEFDNNITSADSVGVVDPTVTEILYRIISTYDFVVIMYNGQRIQFDTSGVGVMDWFPAVCKALK